MGKTDLDRKPSDLSPGPTLLTQWAWFLPSLLTFLFYLPSLNNHFVNFDDTEYIVNNTPIHYWNFPAFQWMATSFHAGYWMPLTWFSYSIDWRLGGGSPFPFHLTNLLLHCANTILVFLLARKALAFARRNDESQNLPGAFFASLLFGLHPLHVESVAWAAERKDVLCAFFFLWSLLSYLRSDLSSKPRLVPCLLLFALALLCKPMAVTLPLILLLLDAWPLGRFSRDPWVVLKEKFPFLALSLASSIIIFLAQSQAGAVMPLAQYPILPRLANAFHSIVFYLQKMTIPTGLSALYPVTAADQAFTPEALAALFLTAGITGLCFFLRKSHPYLGATWVYFLITLLPVLGFLQVGSQAAADRYTYLPSLGPFLLLGAGITALFPEDGKGSRLRALGALALGLSTLLGILTLRQTKTWGDSLALWENVVARAPENSKVAFTNLGDAYREAGRMEEALRSYDQAIAIGPPDAVPHNGRGIVLFELGRREEAITEFRSSIALNPRYIQPHENLWIALQRSGRYEESRQEAERITGLTPGSAQAWDLLAISSAQLNRFEESKQALTRALDMEPDNPELRRHLEAIRERITLPHQNLADFQERLEGR